MENKLEAGNIISNSVERRGDYVDIDTHAVRPALWLKREAVQNRK